MRTWILLALFTIAGCVTTGTNTVDKSKMAEGYFQKGLAFFQERNLEMASVEFNRSIQTDRSYKLSYYYLGLISDSQEKLPDAIKYYKEAIDIDSGFSEAYNALGAIYSKQGKWDDAIKSYQKALENKLYTTPHLPYLNMGRVYMAQKKYPQAIEAFRNAKAFVKQDFIYYDLGNALLEAGKAKEAVKEFQEGVEIAPKNATLRYGLAIALLKDGNKKASIQEFRKVTELAPKSNLALKAQDYLKTLR